MSDQPLSKPPTWREWKYLHRFWRWVLWPEWVSGWVVYWSRNWDFVKALGLAGRFIILFAAALWLLETGDRERARLDGVKAKHYQAWAVINSARGSTGDGGRLYALEDLNEDSVSLVAAPLSKAHLSKVKLPGADLSGADLSEANLSEARLSGADLSEATLSGANLSEARLFRADLPKANLSEANLSKADLTEANLSGANLSGADLSGAELFKARLSGANLSEVRLSKADLTGADLSKAELSNTSLQGAKLCGTTMPDRSQNNSGCSSETSVFEAQRQ